MDIYQVGQVVTLSAEFLNGAGVLSDPGTIMLTVTDPSGTIGTYTYAGLTITKLAVGEYSKDITPNAAGAWTWQWTTTGTPATTQTGYFVVVTKGADGIHDSVQPWASLSELQAQNPAVAAATGAEIGLAEWFLQVASNLAYAASMRQFPGLIESVVRPQHRSSRMSSFWPDWYPIGQSSGSWGGFGCSCNAEPQRQDGYVNLSEVWLADTLQAVIEVRVNGAVVPVTAYAIHDRAFLVRTDGDGWPCSQDMTQDPAIANNTFQVTFLHGKMPPPEGRQAVIDMAGQFYAASVGGDCVLPDELQSLAREGANFTFSDPLGVDIYKTGIRSWEYFISAHNPKHRSRRATFSSPDVGPRYRHVGVN